MQRVSPYLVSIFAIIEAWALRTNHLFCLTHVSSVGVVSDGGLSLAHESSILPDTCVTCGPALPSGVSDSGLSLVHKSSILPDTCVTCGPPLPRGLSDGGLSHTQQGGLCDIINNVLIEAHVDLAAGRLASGHARWLKKCYLLIGSGTRA